jgi:hypothetical protein
VRPIEAIDGRSTRVRASRPEIGRVRRLFDCLKEMGMDQPDTVRTTARQADNYVRPELIVHGSLQDVTQGNVSGGPDIGSAGSHLT